MSLPWIPIYLDDYTGDTMHLTCEEHGAYFQMMLAYYRSERPLPASDRSLAAIVKLPMDRWMECRPTLAAFFREERGFWHHERIEAEIAERASKHAQSIARAQAGAAAMHAKKGHKPASSNAQASPKQKIRPKPATSTATTLPEPVPEVCSNSAHLHIHPSITEGEEGSPSTVSENDQGEEDTIGKLIDPEFRPAEGHLETCRADGASPAQIEHEIAVFIATKQDAGAFSHDWQAGWWKWWLRWRERRAKQESVKPKPRIEVSNTIDWDAHAKRWASGMGWPRGVGADPTSPACRCPPDVLERHGIDPSTGEKLKSTEKV